MNKLFSKIFKVENFFDWKNFRYGQKIYAYLKPIKQDVPILIIQESGFLRKRKIRTIAVGTNFKWVTKKQSIVFTPFAQHKLTNNPEIEIKVNGPLDQMVISFRKGTHNKIIIGVEQIEAYLVKEHFDNSLGAMEFLIPAFGKVLEKYPDSKIENINFM